jgi:uncharacterized protein (TIGR04255 family)
LAPVVEALIDYRVKAREGFTATEFAVLKSALQGRFPKAEERREGRVTVRLSPSGKEPIAMEDLGPQGYFFKTEDEKVVAQFRLDGFTLNRLKPYTRWEDTYPLAAELWGMYVEVARPELLTRIALRYLNKIDFPGDEFPMLEYLTAPPPIPADGPQYVHAFFSRITLSGAEGSPAVHVTQVLEPNQINMQSQYTLDIDAFRDLETMSSDSELDAAFAELRELKNEIFFSHLTERTLRAFD